MARLRLHLHEPSSTTIDQHGNATVCLEIARMRAIQAARAVLCGEVAEGRLRLDGEVTVLDAAGSHLLSIPFRDAIAVCGR